MSERYEYALAMLLPAIAVSWVIADAAMGIADTGRDAAPAMAATQFAGDDRAPAAVDGEPGRATVILCAPAGDVTAATSAPGDPRVSLQRLCRAGLKLSASLPRT